MPRDITTNTFEALGTLLEEHYGRFADNNPKDLSNLRNYATLWDTLLDALKGDSIDRDLFDEVYIRLEQERTYTDPDTGTRHYVVE